MINANQVYREFERLMKIRRADETRYGVLWPFPGGTCACYLGEQFRERLADLLTDTLRKLDINPIDVLTACEKSDDPSAQYLTYMFRYNGSQCRLEALPGASIQCMRTEEVLYGIEVALNCLGDR